MSGLPDLEASLEVTGVYKAMFESLSSRSAAFQCCALDRVSHVLSEGCHPTRGKIVVADLHINWQCARFTTPSEVSSLSVNVPCLSYP